jgi:predicted XRE-type DNA-binding protein
MKFPSKKTLAAVRKKLKNAEGTLMISPDASPLEKFRWDLCQKFLKYKMDHGLSQDQLAELLGVDKSKVSKILHHRIDDFSTDRLVTLYQKIDPDIVIKVSRL